MCRNTSSITTILFDWDGTLLDSAPTALLTFQKTFRQLGIDLSVDKYESIYSPNWYSMYEAVGLPRDRWAAADELWLRHNAELPVQPVAGARATLQELAGRGYRLGLVTSGTGSRVRREASSFCLLSAFEVVVCNEDTTNKKPHPEALEKAMAAMQQIAGNCCYVGDSPEDIRMGKSASLLTVAVMGGYPCSKRLLETDPDICVQTVADILDYFPGYLRSSTTVTAAPP
jgi:HAD superfamily hydrolase (TIGR01509 family)